jgi:hypothetical protein
LAADHWMKLRAGDVVWARTSGQAAYWPAQVCNPEQACEEARCKHLNGHWLVCLYGTQKVGSARRFVSFHRYPALISNLRQWVIIRNELLRSLLQWCWLPASGLVPFDEGWPELAQDNTGKPCRVSDHVGRQSPAEKCMLTLHTATKPF